MLERLLGDLEEFIEMLESDIEVIKQGKNSLTTEQIATNIKNDLAELIESHK